MSYELMQEIAKISDQWGFGVVSNQDALSEIMQVLQRAGEKARSTELLASSEADGHGKNETGKASSDVGQNRCPDCVNGWFQYGIEIYQRFKCVTCEGTGQRSEGRAERLAND